jgi:kinetochore protein Nuf2
MEIIMGVGKDDLLQPALSGLRAFQFPQLHSNQSIPELAFYRNAARLMSACGVTDFSWKDIQKPNIKRVRRHLSAMINFAKFKDERMRFFSEYTTKIV